MSRFTRTDVRMTDDDWAQVERMRGEGKGFREIWESLPADHRHRNPNTLNSSYVARRRKKNASAE